MKTSSLLLALLLAAAPLAAQIAPVAEPGWYWQNPLPQGNTLNGIDFGDSQTGYAAGNAGTVLRTTDAGYTWQRLRVPTDEDLWSVSFQDPMTGTVVGSGGTILRTVDGGLSWTEQASNTSNALRSVRFTDYDHGVAVEDVGRVLRTADGGQTWNLISIPGSTGLFAVSFPVPGRGTAVGAFGRIVRTTDGGTTWEAQASGTSQHLFGVHFFDVQRGLAVGTGGVILRTTNGGANWTDLATGTFQPLYGVCFMDSLRGMAVGLPGTNYLTTDGGENWDALPSGTTSYLRQVIFTTPLHGVAVGQGGDILVSEDGGTNWTEQTSGITVSLMGVSFADINTGMAVGDMGTILRTTNGGFSWWPQNSGTDRTLWGVSCAEPGAATAVGNNGMILTTTDAGAHWTQRTSGTGAQLLGVSHATVSTALAVGSGGTVLRTEDGGLNWAPLPPGTTAALNGVHMMDEWNALAVGAGGAILKTTDGGASWSSRPGGTAENLYGVSFQGPLAGLAVGGAGTILRTTDGGLTWSSQTSGVVVPVNGVAMSSELVANAVGFGGLILRTSNGGIIWTPQSSGTNSHLAGVDLPDVYHGTIVGSGGTILHTTTGGDPALAVFGVSTMWVDFGDVTVGHPAASTVTVANSGNATLMVQEAFSTNSRFTVDPAGGAVPPGSSRDFSVTFNPSSTGLKEGFIVFRTNDPGSPDSVAVRGMGVPEGAGMFLSISPDTMALRYPQTIRFLRPVSRGKGLYPNWANLLSETVVQGGFRPGATGSDVAGGLVVGVPHMVETGYLRWKPNRDSAGTRCWVRLTRWSIQRGLGTGFTGLQKTLLDRTGMHAGPARGFDATGVPGEPNRKPLLRQRTRLLPSKHNNALFAELVALKFNIAASQLGKTPVGFGELILDMPGNPFHGACICDVSARADTMMTYWQLYPQAAYDSLYRAMYAVNRAFAGPLDTISFEADGQLILDGAVALASIPFLKPGTDPPRRLFPVTTLTEATDEFEFGEEEFEEAEGTPRAARLYQNYPNPFNPATTIGFRLREPSAATLVIYDLLGREAGTLLEGEMLEEGYHMAEFDGSRMASGVYFYRLDVAGEDSGERYVDVQRMLLLK
ncbi:MAG: YCF48-related protein [Bacteroidota bacterium]